MEKRHSYVNRYRQLLKLHNQLPATKVSNEKPKKTDTNPVPFLALHKIKPTYTKPGGLHTQRGYQNAYSIRNATRRKPLKGQPERLNTEVPEISPIFKRSNNRQSIDDTVVANLLSFMKTF